MKQSNKLIVVAVLITILCLVYYDFLLKKAYFSGNYKDPYHDFANLSFKDFDTVDLGSSTAANAKFIQGPFNVRIDNNAAEYVKVSQHGRRLSVNAIFKRDYLFNPNPYILIIACPQLNEINTGASYFSYEHAVTDTVVRDDWNMRQVLIDGFRQSRLSIKQDFGSTVVLANNDIQTVVGAIGQAEGSGSRIVARNNNHFGKLLLQVENKSNLVLENAGIDTLNYFLADSAKLIITGNAQNLINRSKHILK